MNKYNRVLISSLMTKKGEPLPQIPITTLSEHEKIAKKNNKNSGGICEIVGLDEYQVKHRSLQKLLASKNMGEKINKIDAA